MNLCIDIGNTTVKAAIFNEGKAVETFRFPFPGIDNLKEIKEKYPEADKVIICSVRPAGEVINRIEEEGFSKLICLDKDTPLPVTNMYRTTGSLGYDRVAAIAGANNICPESNVLVVDAGSAITFDLVTADNKYMGGNISPGMEMRFRALNRFTSGLPLVQMSELEEMDFEVKLMSDNTRDAIIYGVCNSVILEVEGYIKRLGEIFKPLKIIFTGGDANFFDKRLKYPIFVNSNLIFIGLNRILEYNEEF